MPDKRFFKVPKKLILSKEFQNLSNSSKILIIYLLSAYNTFKSNEEFFFQTLKQLSNYSGLSRPTLWRSIEEITNIDIECHKKGHKCFFGIKKFYEKYIEKK